MSTRPLVLAALLLSLLAGQADARPTQHRNHGKQQAHHRNARHQHEGRARKGPTARLAGATGYFAPTSPWNTAMAAVPDLDPASESIVDGLRAQIAAYGTGFATRKWSVPIYTVSATQAIVRVTIDSGNAELQRAFEQVPVPSAARPADGTDAHLVVYQPSTDRMWEMFRAARLADGWHARYGGRILGVSTHPGYYRELRTSAGEVLERPWWGATATSLPLVGGLITLRDLRRGYLDHAIAMAVPRVLQGWKAWPAQRSDGKYTDATAIAEGARFQLDPTVDVSLLGGPPIVRMAARAAQRYGIIVRDGGGAVSFYGEDPKGGAKALALWDTALGGLLPYQVLQSFPFDRLRLMRMDLTPYVS